MGANAEIPIAEAIVAKMASRYATLKSYQDKGFVISESPVERMFEE